MGNRVGSDGRFGCRNSVYPGECSLSLGHFLLSTDLDLSFLGIFLMAHMTIFRFRGFLS